MQKFYGRIHGAFLLQDRVVSYDEEESEKSSHYGIKL